MALPKLHRLRRRQDFSRVYQKGLRCKGKVLTLRALYWAERSQAIADQPLRRSPVRLGISISQKVSKRAVVRNRIKRQLRAAFYSLLPQLIPGWQLVIVVRPNATECDYEQFLQELKQLLVEAEVIDGHSRGRLL